MKAFNIFINFILSFVCIIHVCFILYEHQNPVNPRVKNYDRDLKDIDFPLIFKVCYHTNDELKEFQKWGYDSIDKFYFGTSRFNESLVGWSGHTEHGKTLASPEGSKF